MSIRDEAAEWLLRWHCGDVTIADRFEYLQWLKASPAHIRETLHVYEVYAYLDDAKPLSAEAGSDAERASCDRPHIGVRRRRIAAVAAILAIAASVLTIGWAVLQWANQATGGIGSSVLVDQFEKQEDESTLPVGCTRADTSTDSEAECAETSVRNWSMHEWQGVCAFAVVVPLTLIILIRRRKLTLAHVGPLFAAFMAGGSVPVALDLCSFILPIPHRPNFLVLPEQYALHVSAAGFVMLVVSVLTICQLYTVHLRRGKVPPFPPKLPAFKVPARGANASRSGQERKAG